MKKLELEQNSQEWLDARKQYRTASEAAIVLGISPFTSIKNFKLMKAGLKKQFYSKAMQRGHELEDQVRQHASAHFGKDFKDECWVNGGYMASLDGIDGDMIVEIKVSDHTYNAIKDDDNIPEYYEVQILQQLHCSGAKVGYLYAYSPKKDAYICSTPVELSDRPNFIQELEEAWAKFDAMPVPDGDIDLSDDGSVLKLFKQYELLKHQADDIKAEMDAIKEKLVEKSPDRTIAAQGYKLVRKDGAVSYDYKKAAGDAKIDLTPYQKQGKPSWSVTLPKAPFASED